MPPRGLNERGLWQTMQREVDRVFGVRADDASITIHHPKAGVRWQVVVSLPKLKPAHQPWTSRFQLVVTDATKCGAMADMCNLLGHMSDWLEDAR